MADEPVGYGKPPKHTQFQKGKSGNPRGRPPEPRDSDLAAIFWRALRKKVGVNENGVRRHRQKLDVIATQLANKAASGDLRATQLLVNLLRCFPEPSIGPEPNYEELSLAELEALIMGELEKVKWPRRKS